MNAQMLLNLAIVVKVYKRERERAKKKKSIADLRPHSRTLNKMEKQTHENKTHTYSRFIRDPLHVKHVFGCQFWRGIAEEEWTERMPLAHQKRIDTRPKEIEGEII